MITVSTGFFAFSLVPSSTSHLSIDTCYLPVEFSKNKNKKKHTSPDRISSNFSSMTSGTSSNTPSKASKALSEQRLTVCVLCFIAQTCPTLWDTMDCSPPGSSVHGIFQARILEQVAISYSRGSSQSRDQTHISCISCIGRWIFYHCVSWEALRLTIWNIAES